MKVRICPECKTQNRDSAWHCLNCGATLTTNDVVRSDEKITAVSPDSENDTNRENLAFRAGALAGFLVPLISFMLLTLFFTIYNIIEYPHRGVNYFFIDLYRSLVSSIITGSLVGIAYGSELAIMGYHLIKRKKIETPGDWAISGGSTTFVILLVLTILASPWLLFGIAHMLVEGQEESVWGLFYLYIFLLGLGVVSGYVGGDIFKRLCQRRNL